MFGIGVLIENLNIYSQLHKSRKKDKKKNVVCSSLICIHVCETQLLKCCNRTCSNGFLHTYFTGIFKFTSEV